MNKPFIGILFASAAIIAGAGLWGLHLLPKTPTNVLDRSETITPSKNAAALGPLLPTNYNYVSPVPVNVPYF